VANEIALCQAHPRTPRATNALVAAEWWLLTRLSLVTISQLY